VAQNVIKKESFVHSFIKFANKTIKILWHQIENSEVNMLFINPKKRPAKI